MTSASFLEKLATHILNHYAGNTAQLTVLFPNKRAGLFLKQELAKQIHQSIWLPKIETIEEAFSNWSGLLLADSLQIQFELARIHLQISEDDTTAIGDFLGLAAQMAAEFEDIDQSLADATAVFTYLNEVKALELWHPDGSPLLSSELKYIQFYRSLETYYQQLKSKLLNDGMAYQGMLSAYLANLTESDLLEKIGQNKLIFAGFNAMTKAEEKVISTFVKAGRAEMLWDIDTYYIEKQDFGLHEAGQFARSYFQKYPSSKRHFLSNDLLTQPKQIEIVSVAGNAAQAKALAQNLNRDQIKNHETTIVLADEKLLFPVLNAIPAEQNAFNLTLGFPFSSGVVFQYFKLLFELQQLQKPGQEVQSFFIWPFLTLLRHELNHVLFNERDRNILLQAHQKLSGSGIVFIDFQHLQPLLSESETLQLFFKYLLTQWHNSANNAFDAFNDLIPLMISQVNTNTSNKSNLMVLNQLSIAARIINRTRPLFELIPDTFTVKELASVFQNIAQQHQVPFYGEPLQGLQIMGLLESRNLDFDEVHLLSVNEGILPKEKNYGSMIPADIRKTFQLPGHQERQAVYAYHFYRLLQKARRVFVYYNAIPGEMGGGEPSRFVLQLLHELAGANQKISLTQKTYQLSLPVKNNADDINIEKSALVLQQIREKLARGLSPTALSAYLDCQLRFYFQHILNVTDTSNDQIIAQNVLGTAVHLCLEILFKPFEEKVIGPHNIEDMFALVEPTVETAFQSVFEKGIPTYGRNVLVKQVAIQMAHNFLIAEKVRLTKLGSLQILGLEKKLNREMTINGFTFILKGFIDRIEASENHVEIIDYKTGKVEAKDLSIDRWEMLAEKNASKGLQLLFYRFLMMKSTFPRSNKQLKTSIFSLRSPSNGLMQLSLPTADNDEIDLQTEKFMREMITEMLDPQVNISQTTEKENCTYCPYASICNRFVAKKYTY